MKKVFFLGCALLAIITGASFTSCTNDTDDILAQENEIKLTSAITPASRTNNTDCQSTMIVKGQQIGVTTSGAKEDHKNSPWKAEENGSLTNLGKGLYWNGNQTIDITAYHPYNSQWTGTEHTFTVQTDQYNNGNDNNYINSDLLWVAQRQDYTSAPIELKFGHMLSKIIVYIQGNDFGSNVSLCGTVTSANFNLTNGTVTAQNVTPSEIKVSEGATSAAAIIIPQTVANGTKFIKVEYNGKTFYYTLTKNMTFESGKAYTFNLTLKETENEEDGELILVEGNITPWDEMDNYTSGDAFEEATNNTPAEGTIIIENAPLSTILLAYFGEEHVTLNQNGYAVMDADYVNSITELKLDNHRNEDLTTLDGIENFVNLQHLHCPISPNLAECDLSQNTRLRTFDTASSTKLTSLNLSNNPNIFNLYLNENSLLTELNLTNCTQIYSLQINNTNLTIEETTLPEPSSLGQILCGGSTKINCSLEVFTNLIELDCRNKNFTDSDLTNFIPNGVRNKLSRLNCENNKLTSLDLSEFRQLKNLECQNNQITTLTLSSVGNLTFLDCSGNNLSELNISENAMLTEWHCGNQINNNNNNLKLTLTEEQENKMMDYWNNLNVTCTQPTN